MDKYKKPIDIYVYCPPSMTLTLVPLSSYEIDEWIGKCNDVDVLKYLLNTIHKRVEILKNLPYSTKIDRLR